MRRQVEQRRHCGQEAHVGHAVGLVDDDDLDLVEADLAALDEVVRRPGQATSTSTPRRSALNWALVAGAAVDRGDAAACGHRRARSSSPHTWAASSRVGTSTRARGLLRSGLADRGRRAGCRTRWSCPSRSGRGRRGRGRRARRARSWPGCRSGSSMPPRVEGGDELGGYAELGEGGAGHDWLRLLGIVLRIWCFGRVDEPRKHRSGTNQRARDEYPLAKAPGAATTITHSESHQCSRRHDGAVPAPEDRPVDPTPVHTVDLPATPQRDRTIPATAWIEAPSELLALGRDLGHELVAYKRRIGPWLLWRAGPAAKGNARYAALGGRGSSRRGTRSAFTRRATARGSGLTASSTSASARGRKRCAITVRGNARCDLDGE